MKLKLSIFLIWALLAALFFSGCSTIKPEVGVKYFKVISYNDSTFLAQSGKLKATFFRIDCDSSSKIFVGKIITASRANIIR